MNIRYGSTQSVSRPSSHEVICGIHVIDLDIRLHATYQHGLDCRSTLGRAVRRIRPSLILERFKLQWYRYQYHHPLHKIEVSVCSSSTMKTWRTHGYCNGYSAHWPGHTSELGAVKMISQVPQDSHARLDQVDFVRNAQHLLIATSHTQLLTHLLKSYLSSTLVINKPR